MSRAAIPSNKKKSFTKGWRQVCIYSFPYNSLKIFSSFKKKTLLEEIEDLELNAAKNVGDLNINIKDVEIVSDSNLNIVSVTPPASEAKEDEETEIDTDKDKTESRGDDDKESSEELDKNEDNIE